MFIIAMAGLAGCYMPDNSFIVEVNSIEELKDAINSEKEIFESGGQKCDYSRSFEQLWELLESKSNHGNFRIVNVYTGENVTHCIDVSVADKDQILSHLKEEN